MKVAEITPGSVEDRYLLEDQTKIAVILLGSVKD